MTLRIQLDTRQLSRHLTDVQRRQLPFATQKAVNAVTLLAQEAERAHGRAQFTLRRPEWFDRSIKVTQFATKQSPTATLAVSPPGAADRADILGKFEGGGTKRPLDGRSLMVPVDVRKNKRDIVTRANRPRALLLNKAKNRTFLVRAGDARPQSTHLTPGLYQRVGPKGRAAVKLLFSSIPSAPIAPRLDFVSTVRDTVQQRWAETFEAALRAALATAR